MGAGGGRWGEFAFFEQLDRPASAAQNLSTIRQTIPKTTSKTCKKCKNRTENRPENRKSVE
jgi:hypothetical protein